MYKLIQKSHKMKKTILFVFLTFFTFSAAIVLASGNKLKLDTDKSAVPVKSENRMSEEEISRLTKRVEEIRSLDKTEMTVKEKRELKKEVKEIKKNVAKAGGTVYIGGAALVLIILLVVLLV